MIAIEMDMPKKCDECRFDNPFFDWPKDVCSAKVLTSDKGFQYFEVIEDIGTKPDWCPLIEVKQEDKNPVEYTIGIYWIVKDKTGNVDKRMKDFVFGYSGLNISAMQEFESTKVLNKIMWEQIQESMKETDYSFVSLMPFYRKQTFWGCQQFLPDEFIECELKLPEI